MESPEERFSRIESRIVALEQEEKETIETIKAALEAAQELFKTIEFDLSSSLEQTRESVDEG